VLPGNLIYAEERALNWSVGLVTKLLEVTHGQWLYRNVHVHDRVTGERLLPRKEREKNFNWRWEEKDWRKRLVYHASGVILT
jgi:hypothetical protein